MVSVEAAIGMSGLEHGLRELAGLRAPQINNCGFCIYMRVKVAMKQARPTSASTW